MKSTANQKILDSALEHESQNGHTETVKLLLDAGADVHADCDWALVWASYNGHTETVKALLEAGADVHARNDCALIWASGNGQTEVVKILLAAGSDVHAENDEALRLASQNGHAKTVEVLVKAMTVKAPKAAAKSDAVSKVQVSFKQMGIELTQPQAAEVFKLAIDLATRQEPESPARPAAGAKLSALTSQELDDLFPRGH
jgi:ankyrin repeat protein